MDTKTDRIRALNDELRQTLTGGVALITPGVAALGLDAVDSVSSKLSPCLTIFVTPTILTKSTISDHSKQTDTRSCSRSTITIKELTSHSPDPADPSVTERVITIMLAEEY